MVSTFYPESSGLNGACWAVCEILLDFQKISDVYQGSNPVEAEETGHFSDHNNCPVFSAVRYSESFFCYYCAKKLTQRRHYLEQTVNTAFNLYYT